jgi:hypothetical protein
MDVGGTVAIGDWIGVRDAVCTIFSRRFPGRSLAPLHELYRDVAANYRGEQPGFRACDMAYHDLRHVLDVSLSMARLLDGHERCHAGSARLGYERALLGMCVSLCHDTGYLLRRNDTRHRLGAEYTRIHVTRSGHFLASLLPRLGMEGEVAVAQRLVQFTGYERDVTAIRVPDAQWRRLGHLIGSADLLAQMADRCYLDRCRDRLYPELELAGLTRARNPDGSECVRYRDALDLLRQTPQFMEHALEHRLGRLFERVHRYAMVHFGGRHLYLQAIAHNRALLERALARGTDADLAAPFHAGAAH